MERNRMNRVPKMAAQDALYDYARMMFEPEIRSEYEERLKQDKRLIESKDNTIEELKQRILELERSQIKTNDDEDDIKLTVPIYCNNSLFQKRNYVDVVKVLIELIQTKREKGKYIISKKTDLYMVWKALHYFKVFIGNEYDFITFFDECAIPNILDKDRRKKLDLDDSNFSTIACGNPMKKYHVSKWKQELDNLRYSENCKKQKFRHGDFALERGVIILNVLQQLLEKRNIPFINAEK